MKKMFKFFVPDLLTGCFLFHTFFFIFCCIANGAYENSWFEFPASIPDVYSYLLGLIGAASAMYLISFIFMIFSCVSDYMHLRKAKKLRQEAVDV